MSLSSQVGSLRVNYQTKQESTATAVLMQLAPVGLALLLWLAALPTISLRRITDIGLIAALPPLSLAALALLVAGFCLALARPQVRGPVLALHVVVLLFMLYGVTALIEESPRYPVAWLHAGFTEYVMRTGQTAPMLDARFNWPGFFSLTAFATQVAGLESALALMSWTPVFLNLLYLGPLLAIFSAVGEDARLRWLGVWFFYLANHVGQDYFSPQGLNYFFYLVILAILLGWFRAKTVGESLLWGVPGLRMLVRRSWLGKEWLAAEASRWPRSSTPVQRVGLLLIALVLFVAVTVSHPLTPFFVLLAVTLLALFDRIMLRGLPLIMGVVLATWIAYMTTAFLSGHPEMVIGAFGQIGRIVDRNVTERLSGSPGHLLVTYGRLGLTLVVWGLAALGLLRRIRVGHRDLSLLLLAAAPFALLVLQNYGGEMLLRVYLFSLPFVAFFAAALFWSGTADGQRGRVAVMIGLVSLGLLAGFLLVRYGNEKMDYISTDEFEAVATLYETAEPGALLAASSYNLPWKYRDYERFSYLTLKDEVLFGGADAMINALRQRQNPYSYLILTRSQGAYLELFYHFSPEDWQHLQDSLIDSGQFAVVHSSPDALILALKPEDDDGGGQ